EDRDGAAGRGLGWWDGMIGPGKAFATDRYLVVSTNLLGGCRGTTGPSSINPSTARPYGPDFPVITAGDMVRTPRAFLGALRLEALDPQGVAWNAIAREAIMRDPAWQGGHYYGTGRAPDGGMGVARMVGHITYLSAPALAAKFGRRLQHAADIRYTITDPEFA